MLKDNKHKYNIYLYIMENIDDNFYKTIEKNIEGPTHDSIKQKLSGFTGTTGIMSGYFGITGNNGTTGTNVTNEPNGNTGNTGPTNHDHFLYQ